MVTHPDPTIKGQRHGGSEEGGVAKLTYILLLVSMAVQSIPYRT